MKKRIYFTLFSLLSGFQLFAETQSGSCGELATWIFEGNTLTISGSGPTTNHGAPFSIYETYPEWQELKDKIKHVIVCDGITSIGDFSFYKYPALESVTLPEGLTRIGNYTFFGCSLLKKVNFPETLKRIGDPLLNYQSNGFSFYSCTSLEEICLPEGLEVISGGSFNGCVSLRDVYWNSVNCKADVLDPILRYTGIFMESGLTNLYFGSKVKEISDRSFDSVGSLTNITTTGSIEFVGYNAFNGTNWEKSQNSTIYIDKTLYKYNPPYNQDLIKRPYEFTVSENTVGITDRIFEGDTLICKITIPESVRHIGSNAFKGCSRLQDVVWNVIELDSKTGYSGSKLFSDSLRSITFGDKVKVIPPYFLYGCQNLIELNLPVSLESIGENAVQKCHRLKSLNIPDNVKSLGSMSIAYCDSLQSITIGEGLIDFDYYYLFTGCPQLKTLYWNAIEPTEKTFDPYHKADACKAPVEHVIFGDNVRYIPGQLFWDNATLKDVEFGNSVEKIGEAAFRGCSQITKISLPKSLKTICDYAFGYVPLESIILPESLVEMGGCFGHNNFNHVIILPTTPPVTTSPFDKQPDETIFYVPDVEIYKNNRNWNGIGPHWEPLVTADRTEFLSDEIDLHPAFTSNIPGYTLASIVVPHLERSEGEHTATLTAEFIGEQDFSCHVIYRYKIIGHSSIEDVTDDKTYPIEVYNLQGVKILDKVSLDEVHSLPKGIYILKTTGKVEKIRI